MLLGLDDGKDLGNPVEGINPVTGERVGTKKHKLLYLKPFDQSVVTILSKESNVNSPRFGFPSVYSIQFDSGGSSDIKSTKTVHWTRVLHIADSRECSEVFGTPRMECVYDRLLDLRKILGGSGEMFWRGGFPGLSFETGGIEEGALPMDTEALIDQVERYMQGLQRYLATENITVKSLSPQVASPKEHVETHMRQIAISLGIPYRIFLGSEEAKLASSEDKDTWNGRLRQRQDFYVTPYVIRVFIDRLIILGVLPEPKEYFVYWPDLDAPSDKDKAEVGKLRTEAMASYVASGVEVLIPPHEYMTLVLGMTEEEAMAIEKAVGKFIMDEDRDAEDSEDSEEDGGPQDNQ